MAIGAIIASAAAAIGDAAVSVGTAVATTAADIGASVGIGTGAAAAGSTGAALGLDAATAADMFGMTAAEMGASVGGGAAAAASSLPGWLTMASVGSQLAGGITGAIGAQQAGAAQSATAKYNAQVAAQNAAIAHQNAGIAGMSGSAQAEQEGMKNKAVIGAILSNQAASGIDVNSGSALDVRSSARELGELNVLTLQSNAARQAFGYQTQEKGFQAESQLGQSEAQYAKAAADISTGTTLLGSVGNAGLTYARYLQSSGINPLGTQTLGS